MNNEMNVFEIASKLKLRFPYRGNISVEDLWDLPLEDLDTIFKTLNREAKQSSEESLLDAKSDADEKLEMQIAIVKHIVGVKQREAAARLEARERREQRRKLEAILYEKRDEEIRNKSAEEIEAMLKDLS